MVTAKISMYGVFQCARQTATAYEMLRMETVLRTTSVAGSDEIFIAGTLSLTHGAHRRINRYRNFIAILMHAVKRYVGVRVKQLVQARLICVVSAISNQGPAKKFRFVKDCKRSAQCFGNSDCLGLKFAGDQSSKATVPVVN